MLSNTPVKNWHKVITLVGLTFCIASGAFSQASKVVVNKGEDGYQLLVNGAPFFAKGVGLSYKDGSRIRALKQAGGNVFRTWSTQSLDQELAMAKELGLMVAVGLATGKQLQGFDYNNDAAVAAQYTQMTAIIDKYKDHPNVLCWVIANEPNLYRNPQGEWDNPNPKVYDALADITDYIHENDPNHPVTIAFAGAGEYPITTALTRIPNLDIVSVQLYGDLINLPSMIAKLNIDKPFMVTEFGPTGHWERPTTSWGREIEEPSALKAAAMVERMTKSIINDPSKSVIGSFAFLWGQKQERTPTWYGMFNASGEQTARIDELTRIWTGSYPKNRAPLSYAITIDGLQAQSSVSLKPGAQATAKLLVRDPDGDPLTFEWRLMEEVGVRSDGGHYEKKPKEFKATVIASNINDDGVQIEFVVPKVEGEYRLFAYSYDGHNHVANANFPFKVIR